MNMKNVLIFIGGLAVGAAAGVLGSKKYFQDKYQKQYEEDFNALEEYNHRTDEYTREKTEEEEFEDDGVNPIETDSRPGGRMSPEERAARKNNFNRDWKGTVNYAGMYREKNGYTERKLAEAEHPLDQGEIGEEDLICENCKNFDYDSEHCKLTDEAVNGYDSCSDFVSSLSENNYNPEEEAFDDHQKNKNKPPKIISADAYEELPTYIEKKVLYLYAYDETLVDEDNDNEPIIEPEQLIGDSLTKYDFIDNDERIIFVMNYALDTCYEIQKVDASWTDSH